MKKAVSIGALKHRITIQRLVLTPDGQGGNVDSWTDVATVWADVQPVSSSERLYTRQVQYQRTHKVIIRYLVGLTNDLTSKHRFTFGGRTFQIKGVYNLKEEKFWQIIDAEENTGK